MSSHPAADIVTVAHPALVVRASGQGEAGRPTLARIDTPIRLRTLASCEAPEGPLIPVDRIHWVRTRLIEGQPWRVVGDDEHARTDAGDVEERFRAFRDWLAGRGLNPARPDQSRTLRCFAGSPLVAYGCSPEFTHPVRPLRTGEARRGAPVVRDYREDARTALTAYFERNVALVDGLPMVRFRGPAAQFAAPSPDETPGKPSREIMIPRYPGWPDPKGARAGFHYRVDRAAEVRQLQGFGRVLPDWDRGIRWERKAYWGDCRFDGVDDVWLSLHAILHRLHYPVAGATRVEWEVEARRSAALDLVERSVTHMLTEADLTEACVRCRFAHPEEPEAGPFTPVLHPSWLDYVRHYALEVLEEEGFTRGPDMEALGDLSPHAP